MWSKTPRLENSFSSSTLLKTSRFYLSGKTDASYSFAALMMHVDINHLVRIDGISTLKGWHIADNEMGMPGSGKLKTV